VQILPCPFILPVILTLFYERPIRRRHLESAKGIAHRVTATLQAFRGSVPPADDITLVVV
jgi:hypothetical protein